MATTNPLQRIARSVLLPLSVLSDRLGNAFYAGLAVLVIAWASFAILTGATSGMKNKAYDMVAKPFVDRFTEQFAQPRDYFNEDGSVNVPGSIVETGNNIQQTLGNLAAAPL